MTGHATKEAAEQVREQIARYLAEEMGCDPGSISFKNGTVLFDGVPAILQRFEPYTSRSTAVGLILPR